MIVVSIGCPAGVGPEVTLAAVKEEAGTLVLVGDDGTIRQAAELTGMPARALRTYSAQTRLKAGVYCHPVAPALTAADRRPGRPSPRAGESQLVAIEAAYQLAKELGAPLVTGPVSKAAIVRSGLARARRFVGHTEYLGKLDGGRSTTMCFHSARLVTGLVTTHRPLSSVACALTPARVSEATVQLALLLRGLGHARPKIAVASLNPHAGEEGLFGREESSAIVPGMEMARKQLGRRAQVAGPIGAETAYRLAYAGHYAGVVAMYHDQATIPMKLVAFGDAVNVTMGLSVVRTSVDHGTAYDIAWRGQADAAGMRAAIRLARTLSRAG